MFCLVVELRLVLAGAPVGLERLGAIVFCQVRDARQLHQARPFPAGLPQPAVGVGLACNKGQGRGKSLLVVTIFQA